jgi:hypothetical protein
LTGGWSDADALTVATASVQLAILGISALGTGYVFFGLAWRLLRAPWRQRTPRRRAAALVAISVIVTLVALQWAGVPQ